MTKNKNNCCERCRCTMDSGSDRICHNLDCRCHGPTPEEEREAMEVMSCWSAQEHFKNCKRCKK